jgi:sugar (pentulose or hexulose) kinase
VLEVSTTTLTQGGGAALGDAVLAGVAAGVFSDFAMSRELCATGELLEPEPDAVATYRDGLAIFRETYRALRGPTALLSGASELAVAAAEQKGDGSHETATTGTTR